MSTVVDVSTLRAANDVLRFALELASLAGLAVWGWGTGPTGLNVVLAIAAPLAAAALWGAFVAPKAPRPTSDPLEETPEFLEESEEDRLWFEQRPPKDFDF